MATSNAINANSAGMVHYDGAGTFSGNTTTNHSIILGSTSNTITSLGAATNGQLPIGSTGNAPSLATITAGTGIGVSNGAGSITISATGTFLPWTDVTGTTQTIAVNNGYLADNAGTVTLTLPATAAQFSVFAVAGGPAAGGWSIAQNASQTITLGSATTTAGAGGSLSSTNANDCVYVLCTVANTAFLVLNSIGNITVV